MSTAKKVLHVLWIIESSQSLWSSFKAMMQNAIEHSDSTASTEFINIPNIEVFF